MGKGKNKNHLFILYLCLLFLAPFSVKAKEAIWQASQGGNSPRQQTSLIFARVGNYLYNIEGLTSPGAQVRLVSSQGNIRLETIADSQGIFRFYHLLSPQDPGMFCFFNRDRQGRSSPPLCLWPPTPRREQTLRGILLPPSFSLSQPQRPGQKVFLSGLAIPGSQLTIHRPLTITHFNGWWRLVFAKTKPLVTIMSQPDGSFRQILTPTNKGRVYLGISYHNAAGPPSYPLDYQFFSWRRWGERKLNELLKKCGWLWRHYLYRWQSLFVLELGFLLFLFFSYAQRKDN